MVNRPSKCYNPPPTRGPFCWPRSCPKESEPSGGFCFWTPNCRYFEHVRYWSLWVGCRALNLSRIFGSDILFPLRPHRLVRSRTQGFHPWNRGSNPLGVMSSHAAIDIAACVSFWLAWMLFVPVGLASPPIDPANLRNFLSTKIHVPQRWRQCCQRMIGQSLQRLCRGVLHEVGESVALHGEVLQQGGFPHPWRDLEEWFVSTEHGTIAVYMKTPSSVLP